MRVISDNYVAPGTQVSGRLGNTVFSGTVVHSPSTEERLGNLEKRLAAVESPSRAQINKLESTVLNVKSRLGRLEGGDTMDDRIRHLEKRIFHLQHRGGGLSSSLFKDNAEGFHFHGAIGPNTLMPTVDKMEQSVSDIEKLPSPDKIIRPVMKRLDVMESRINDLMAGGEDPRSTIGGLEKRLVDLENKAKVFKKKLVVPDDDAR